jgi:hypothetical protein
MHQSTQKQKVQGNSRLQKNGTSYKRSAELAEEAGSGPPVEAALIAISHSTTAASIAK